MAKAPRLEAAKQILHSTILLVAKYGKACSVKLTRKLIIVNINYKYITESEQTLI